MNIWRVSCPWIRKDPPRSLVLLLGYMVALIRHQYVRRRRPESSQFYTHHHQSDPFFNSQNHIQLSATADTRLVLTTHN